LLDPVLGLLEYAQGDTPIWFDGAGFGDITAPILIGIGDGSTTDFPLPHRYWLVSSMVVYVNKVAVGTWSNIGGDGITTDSIRFSTAPAFYDQITVKGRRKIKCVLMTSQKPERARVYRSITAPTDTIHRLKIILQEIAN